MFTGGIKIAHLESLIPYTEYLPAEMAGMATDLYPYFSQYLMMSHTRCSMVPASPFPDTCQMALQGNHPGRDTILLLRLLFATRKRGDKHERRS